MRPRRDAQTSGLVLLPVVLVLLTVGSIAFLLNHQAAMHTEIASHSAGLDEVRYVAEAGFEHERWRLDRANCTGYTNLPSTAFGTHSYSATVTPTLDSPVAITATGTLTDGATRTYSRLNVRIYAAAVSVSFQPGSAGKEAWVNSVGGSQTDNYGASVEMEVDADQKHTLLRFELAAIPITARVLSAQLQLHLINMGGPGADITAHRVTRSWQEGTGNGTPSGDGATWNTHDGVGPWSVAGGDYDPAVVASTFVSGSNADFIWDLSGPVDDWVSEIRPNEGLLLRGLGGGRAQLASSDHAIGAERPQLTVTYALECGTGPSAPTKMYWVDMGQIRRADLDGSNVEDLVTTGLLETEGIDLDVAAGKMYWTDQGTDKVQRANLDGTVVEDLVDGLGAGKKVAIALDIAGGKMYYTDAGVKEILRANLDGANIEALVSGLSEPRGIALDVAAGKMYWTDEGNELIQRANLDGSNIENLVTGGKPRRVELDLVAGKIYWPDGGAGKIQRANLDGTVVEDLVTGLGETHGITVDFLGLKIYWTDAGNKKIQRANLDGSSVEALVTTGHDKPRGIALD